MSNERKVLELVRKHKCIRQRIDNVGSPSSLVLEYLDDNLLYVCRRGRLQNSDLKVSCLFNADSQFLFDLVLVLSKLIKLG